jgi:hypothetical protein
VKPHRIDVVMQRWAASPTRRSVVQLLMAVILAAIVSPLRSQAKTPHPVSGDSSGKPIHDPPGGGGSSGGGGGQGGKKGGKGKGGQKKTKQCPALAQQCLANVNAYCYLKYYAYDWDYYNLCRQAYLICCGPYRTCETAKGLACINATTW